MASILIGWKAWYSDGMSITSKTNKWIHIPQTHFQILKKFDDHNEPEIVLGNDLFCITSDPLEIERLIKEDVKNIKIGEMLPDGHFSALQQLARIDPEIVDVMV